MPEGCMIQDSMLQNFWSEWYWFLKILSPRISPIIPFLYRRFVVRVRKNFFIKRLKFQTSGSIAVVRLLTKGKFGNKCILSYHVPVQRIVSPYDVNCVTPLIYLSKYWSWFPFLDNCLVWLNFLFFVTFTQPFCKRHYPAIVITNVHSYMYTSGVARRRKVWGAQIFLWKVKSKKKGHSGVRVQDRVLWIRGALII